MSESRRRGRGRGKKNREGKKREREPELGEKGRAPRRPETRFAGSNLPPARLSPAPCCVLPGQLQGEGDMLVLGPFGHGPGQLRRADVEVTKCWEGGRARSSLAGLPGHVLGVCLALRSLQAPHPPPTAERNEVKLLAAAVPPGLGAGMDPSSTAHAGTAPLSTHHAHLPALYPTATRPKLKKMKSQTGQVGEKQSLKCEAAAGNPQPSYRWFKDGKELNRSRDIRIKYGNGRKNSRLQFNKVKVEDAGEYVCEAENILGKDAVRGRLHVNSVSTTLSSWSGHARKCNETAKSYCVNGGVCYYIEGINQLSCKCPVGYTGDRCQQFAMVNFSKHLGFELKGTEPLCVPQHHPHSPSPQL
ncbi:Pro-neuregulin-2, membrane-bound isoform [Galemys pyrenaicus]|uniref:Pro-neuregulin-2, membrane-bound isoform n=1 Tax=Galemys pyrenaicus TaxID=202257 RepID=A0A8J5ZJE6_GALPY|nr:Pro-neuregulin-2, membrane-bound isoform [Galemys pyrenaicus]